MDYLKNLSTFKKLNEWLNESRIEEITKSDNKTTDNETKYWYYVISATVGAPGFSESEKYESVHFNSFEECFRDYVAFNPHKKFYELRRIGSESFIYVHNNKKHFTSARGGILFYDNAETELGTTEDEFDKIIASYNV